MRQNYNRLAAGETRQEVSMWTNFFIGVAIFGTLAVLDIFLRRIELSLVDIVMFTIGLTVFLAIGFGVCSCTGKLTRELLTHRSPQQWENQ